MASEREQTAPCPCCILDIRNEISASYLIRCARLCQACVFVCDGTHDGTNCWKTLIQKKEQELWVVLASHSS